jgi:parallel beta-helix repeat protein
VANSRFSDGILVNGGATETLLERNTANESGHDGIEVSAAGTTVTRNSANFNHDLGIEAVPGVIDGGGKRLVQAHEPGRYRRARRSVHRSRRAGEQREGFSP